MCGETSRTRFEPVFSSLWSTIIISNTPIVSEVCERKNEMRQHQRLFALATVILLSACGPQAPPTPPPVVDGSSLLSTLEGAGARLREVDAVTKPIEGAVSRAYSVNGEEILIYHRNLSSNPEKVKNLFPRTQNCGVPENFL